MKLDGISHDHVVKMANDGVVAMCEIHSIQFNLDNIVRIVPADSQGAKKKKNDDRNVFDGGVGDADGSISGKCVHALETIKIKLAVECWRWKWHHRLNSMLDASDSQSDEHSTVECMAKCEKIISFSTF